MTDWPVAWGARWIWAAGPPVPATPLPVAVGVLPERTCYLRTSLTLQAVPDAVPCRVSADSRFVLYVNGAEVARGPARTGRDRIAYEGCDLAPHLREGRNVVAAFCRFYGLANAWWIPSIPANEIGFGSFVCEAPAIGLRSDASWRALALPDRPAGRGVEDVDGSAVPWGWLDAGFDDSVWQNAVALSATMLTADPAAVPSDPFVTMEPSGIAALTAIAVPLTEISRTDDSVVFDAGGMTFATPWLDVHGAVDVVAAEDLADGVPAPVRFAARFAGDGRFEALDAAGFRYLAVTMRDGARLDAAGATERRYPREPGAWFRSGDERLDRIWETGARTLDLCSNDAFLDCPGREQRAWVGDAYVHSMLTFVTNPDWRLAKRMLRLCAGAQRGDGLLAMAAACEMATWPLNIVDYSLQWVCALARWHEYSGDLDTVEELVPTASQVLAWFERYRAEDGLLHSVPGWVFIDWAQLEHGEVCGALDALCAKAQRDYATLEDALGDPKAARRARGKADRTAEAFETLYDGSRGVYVDVPGGRRVSQHTNAMAILAGCAPSDRWSRMVDHTLDPKRLKTTLTAAGDGAPRAHWTEPPAFDAEHDVVRAQPFFAHFVHQAVARAGRRDRIPDLCRQWGPQLDSGNGTFEELWPPVPGRMSRCHAWSATPTFDLTTHVLGVRPLEPGYATVEVRPMLDRFPNLAGSVPTPHGPIEVDGTSVKLPPGVRLEEA